MHGGSSGLSHYMYIRVFVGRHIYVASNVIPRHILNNVRPCADR